MARELSTLLGSDANLQGYWRLESNGNDSSSNAYNLTGSGSPTHVVGKFGNCVDLEASTPQYYTIADASCANLSLTGSFTLTAWVKVESLLPASMEVIDKDSGSPSGGGYGMNILNTGQSRLVVRGDDDSSHTHATAAGLITAGNWHFVACRLDTSAQTASVFVDGNREKHDTGQTYSPKDNAMNFSLGIRHTDLAVEYDGLIDDAAVFDRALTDAEIKSLYRGSPKVIFI